MEIGLLCECIRFGVILISGPFLRPQALKVSVECSVLRVDCGVLNRAFIITGLFRLPQALKGNEVKRRHGEAWPSEPVLCILISGPFRNPQALK